MKALLDFYKEPSEDSFKALRAECDEQTWELITNSADDELYELIYEYNHSTIVNFI